MITSQSRVLRSIVVAAALAAVSAPAAGSAGSSGEPATTNPQESVNPTLRNDRAHFPQDSARSEQTGGSSAPVVVRVDGGFDLAAAGVGAAGGLGLALALGGAAAALRRRQPGNEARA